MQEVLGRITREELVRLALDLCNIPSSYGREKEAAEFVYRWFGTEGFERRYIPLVEDRPNVAGRLRGSGTGQSLIFNSHLDTAVRPGDTLSRLTPDDPFYNQAWVDDDVLCGEGVCNDKGPMAAFLLAAKAIKDSGAQLKGDLWLTAVPGEIGQEPVDEFQGPGYLGKEVGTRFMVTHGVVADHALVAETSDFCPIWVEAGKAFFKVVLFTRNKPVYTPYVERTGGLAEASNAIVRLAPFIESFEQWAREYEKRNRYECKGGVVVPRASINAVRGGLPYQVLTGPQVCNAYIDVRLLPGQDPLDVRDELRSLVAEAGLEADVELYLYRRGYESQGVGPLSQSILDAHRQVIGDVVTSTHHGATSMWRDIIVFSELGIPAICYGPPRTVSRAGHKGVRIDDLLNAARVYALVALDICRRDRNPKQ